MKLLALTLSLLMCLFAGASALAAEPSDEEVSPQTEATEPVSAENADAALEEEIRAADEAATSNAIPATADRNDPFIPTVQISEDLSVSFPVDI